MTLPSKHGITYDTCGLIIKRADALKAGDLVLLSINSVTDFDRVESATPFVGPGRGADGRLDAVPVINIEFAGSHFAKTYRPDDSLTVAV